MYIAYSPGCSCQHWMPPILMVRTSSGLPWYTHWRRWDDIRKPKVKPADSQHWAHVWQLVARKLRCSRITMFQVLTKGFLQISLQWLQMLISLPVCWPRGQKVVTHREKKTCAHVSATSVQIRLLHVSLAQEFRLRCWALKSWGVCMCCLLLGGVDFGKEKQKRESVVIP